MIDLLKIRHHLHQHPELSGEEKATQNFIIEQLATIDLSSEKIGGTGVITSLGAGDLHILIRVDIDALPIHEINSFHHASKNKGVSHMCGHDGHTTIGIGLAQYLKNNPIGGIRVSILFQPAEENGLGAKAVLEDPLFKKYDIDYVVALHNIPGMPMHQLIVKDHSFTPAVHSLKLKFSGKTSHAAEPENGFNPHHTVAEVIQYAEKTENMDRSQDDFILYTPIYTEIGTKNYGISPGYGEIHFTMRSWNQKFLDASTESFINFATELAAQNNLELNSEIFEKFHANQNDPKVVSAIEAAGEQLRLNVQRKEKPFSFGEDFGLFTQIYPGAMFGLGAGENVAALHNPNYDFPDEITSTAIELFYNTILKLQHAK